VLDRLMAGAMSLAFDRALTPSAEEAARLQATAAPYLDERLQRNPRAFFAFLDDPPKPPDVSVRGAYRVRGGVVASRSFRSCYTPFGAVASEPCPENETIHVRHWMHDRPARATVVALHGFTMGHPEIDAHVLMAPRWFDLGLDVAMMTLPFHGLRAAATSRYSGEGFGTWDVARLNEAVRRSVHDVDVVRRWLVAETGAAVGLLGLSLGGYLSALLAGLRDDWAFAVPIVPPVCLSALPTRLRALVRRSPEPPVPVTTLRRAYGIHSPLAHPLRIPRGRVFIVAGRGDWIVPPEHPLALWRHWGRPAIRWYSGGHLAPFGRARMAAAVAAHLCRLGVCDAPDAAALSA
jgi:hypothetical protein